MRKLNVHGLRRSLNHLCRKLTISCSINSGGCCYVAYLIAYHLDKLGIKYRLVIFSEDPKITEDIQEEVKNQIRNNSEETSVTGLGTCAHYTIYLEGGGLVNAGGFKGRYKYYSITGVNSSNIRWVYKRGDWNSWYDTNNNKRIRKIFRAFFSEYEKRDRISSDKDAILSLMLTKV